MRVLVALDENFKSNGEIQDRSLYAYEVNNVICAYEDLYKKPKVYMNIVGETIFGLTAVVADQKAGDDLIRQLCSEGHLDLTCYDVCMENFDGQGLYKRYPIAF